MTYASDMTNGRHRQYRWIAAATALLLLGAVFRLVALQDVPPGLAQDEVLNADIVTFIRGGEHAFFFSYGYGHEPLYHYWSVPFQMLLGDNYLSIRLPAVVLGMLLIALALRWARRDFGAVAAVVTGFGLAVGWWPVIFSRIGLRPIMEPVLILVAVLLWPVAGAGHHQHRIPRTVLAGAVLGLTLYTYTAARVLFVLPLLFGLYNLAMSWLSARRSSASVTTSLTPAAYREQAALAAIVLLIMGVVSLPLFLTLRSDPTLQQRVDQLSGPLDALQEGDLGPVMTTTTATLGAFGLTGDPRWTYSLPDRPLFQPVIAVMAIVGLALALWGWRRPQMAFAVIWLAVGLVPSAVTPDAPSSVRLVGAMPVIYLMPGIALAAVVLRLRQRQSSRPDRVAAYRIAVALGFGILGIIAITRTVRDGFTLWPQALETRLKYQSVLLDISRDIRLTGDGPQLDGTASQVSPPVIADGFFEPIDDASLRRDYNGDLQARWVQTGAEFGGAIVWPDANRPGSPVASYLYVPEFAAVAPGLLAQAGIDEIPTFRSDGDPSYAVYQLSPPADLIPSPLRFTDAGTVLLALNGVALRPSRDADEASEAIILYTDWFVESELPADLAIFIHLVDASGQVVAQYDGLDAAASTLHPGDRFLQRHVVDLPNDLSDDSYSLRLGLYRRTDGARLLTPDKRDVIEVAQCPVLVGEDSGYELRCELLEEW